MMLTDQELQSLRNLGNEAEAAADEIERLRAHHFFAMHNPSVCNGRMMGEPMRYTPECVPLKAENERLRQQLADVAMSLKTCAWALRRGAAPELGERSLELLKKYDLLGSPLRA